MKFLFVAPRFHTNQIHWVGALKSNGNDVKFLVLNKSRIENYTSLEPEIVEICSLSKLIIKLIGPGGANYYRGFPNPYTYYKNIKRKNPDIVIIRDLGRWLSLLTTIITRLQKKNIVIYSQTNLYRKRSKIRLLIFKLVFSVTKGIWVTPIEGIKNEGIKIPTKLFYIPFAVKIDYADKKYPVDVKSIKILTVGKFVERKNHSLLVKCVKQLIDNGLNIRLHIIGECTNAEHRENIDKLKYFICKNNLQSQIDTIINVSHQDIENYYKLSDIFVLPATKEPASISVVEALGFGLPVICSNNCGTQYYIKEDFNGYIFEDNSLKDLYQKLTLLCSKGNIIRLKQNIAGTVDTTISTEHYYRSFMSLIKTNFGIAT